MDDQGLLMTARMQGVTDATESTVTEYLSGAIDGFWYVATPYSKYDYGMEMAAREACRVTGYLMRAGVPVFCPIAHSHAIAHAADIDPGDHSFWLPVDTPMMRAAHGLIVVGMSGYSRSTGVGHEIDHFRQAGKPVIHLPWDDSHLECGTTGQASHPNVDFHEPMTLNSADPGTKSFSTGAVRSDDADNTRYDLISPIGLRRLAETCREGAEKYSDFNWEKGMPVGEMLNHGIKHLFEYLAGDRSEDHLAHAAWNCMAAMHSEELWPELNAGTLRTAGCIPPNGQAAG